MLTSSAVSPVRGCGHEAGGGGGGAEAGCAPSVPSLASADTDTGGCLASNMPAILLQRDSPLHSLNVIIHNFMNKILNINKYNKYACNTQ